MMQNSSTSAFAESATPSQLEFSVAAPISSNNEEPAKPSITHTGWPSRKQYSPLSADRGSLVLTSSQSVSERMKVFADVVVDFCAANLPRGQGTAVRRVLEAVRSSPLSTAITVH